MKGYFYSDTVFKLSNKVLTENVIKIFEKGFDFATILRQKNNFRTKICTNNFNLRSKCYPN